MVIYADVLIVVNIFINYFLLLLTSKINFIQHKTLRITLGAVTGGFSSLIILLPLINALFDIIYKLIIAALMILISFGFIKIKVFLRNVFTLFASTYLFAGIMFSVWYVFKPQKVLINNSTVYFDISISYLIILTIVIYLAIIIIGSFLKKEAISAKKCKIKLYIDDKMIELDAIIDTGNSLDDILGSGETITVSNKQIRKICDGQNIIDSYPIRYRVLPCNTVIGSNILEGIRCDFMEVCLDGKIFNFKNPVAVASKSDFSDEFDAILNSEILMKLR